MPALIVVAFALVVVASPEVGWVTVASVGVIGDCEIGEVVPYSLDAAIVVEVVVVVVASMIAS